MAILLKSGISKPMFNVTAGLRETALWEQSRQKETDMHAMEKAILELKLEKGDEIGFSFSHIPLIQGPQGTPVPAMINGRFQNLIAGDDSAVMMVDMGAGECKVIHTAINANNICQIGKVSEITTSKLHTIQ
jgi:hypothetical protein